MNGYFQLINGEGQTSVCLYPPIGEGNAPDLNELVDYLNFNGIRFSIPSLYSAAKKLKKDPLEVLLSKQEYPPIDEVCRVRVSRDAMSAHIRFYAPSTGGNSLRKKEILSEIEHRGVMKGLLEDVLEGLFSQREYCKDYCFAVGQDTLMGQDGYIEFFFEQEAISKPDLMGDGSLDLRHLFRVNECKSGDTIARIHPPKEAVNGYTVLGDEFPGEPGKEKKLKTGINVSKPDSDGAIKALKDGRIRFEKDRVSVYPVLSPPKESVPQSPMEFDGSIIIDGDVRGGVIIKATGDVIISGRCEDSYIDAGGDVIICQEMDGRNKGTIKAGGSVMGASFVNTTIKSGNSVYGDFLLHSNVMASNRVIVSGPRGIVSGGNVSARNGISSRVLGNDDGRTTMVEIGRDPDLKSRVTMLEEQIQERDATMKEAYPVLSEATAKVSRGEALSPGQLKSLKELHTLYNNKKKEQKRDKLLLKELKEKLSMSRSAVIEVSTLIHPGTIITIGESSMEIGKRFEAGRFIREREQVKYVPAGSEGF